MDSVRNTEWYIPQFAEHFDDKFIFTSLSSSANIFVSKHPVVACTVVNSISVFYNFTCDT